MPDSVSRKCRIPHWGWLLAGTMLMVPMIPLTWHQMHQFILVTNLRSKGLKVETEFLEAMLFCPVNGIYIGKFEEVVAVDASGCQLTETDLSRIAEFPLLKKLLLGDAQITDAGLVNLLQLTSLQTLEISGPQITDAGMKHLAGIYSLRKLVLKGTQVTPAGVAKLQRSKYSILGLEITRQ